jgi:hypothetical protein
MTVLIKYCGGCNTRYDRGAFVGQLGKEFPGIELLYANAGFTEADIVLVVCGCPAKCASHGTLHGRLDKIIIASPEEYGTIKEKLKNCP